MDNLTRDGALADTKEQPAHAADTASAPGVSGSPRSEGSRTQMRRVFEDRHLLIGLAILAPIALTVGAWSFLSEMDQWRTDTMQALDRGGLYLFILSPCYASICAWAAVSRYGELGTSVEGLPDASLVWRRTWTPYAVVATAFHVVYLVALLAIAESSGSSGGIDVLPLVVQLLSIPFFCAVGAAVGGRWRSVITAPVLFLLLLGANTLLVQYGFRRISEVGTGSADFIDLKLSVGYLLPKLVLFAAGAAWALPVRWGQSRPGFAGRLGSRVRLVPALVAVLMVLWIWGEDGQAQVYSPGTPVCQRTPSGVTLCVPPDVASFARDYDTAVDQVSKVTASTGASSVPTSIALVSRGATRLPAHTVIVTVTSTSVREAAGQLRDVVFGYAYAQACDDPTSEVGPPNNVLETHAVLDGWLQHQVGINVAGTYPTDAVKALEALPASAQAVQVKRMLDGVWTCDKSVKPYGVTGP